jgi:hypothetical protein
MSGYNTNLQVYYCKQTEEPSAQHRISPAPIININPEIYYANDNVIGYTYIISLNGYSNALRREIDSSSSISGLSGVIDHIGDIREIFNTNGGNLYIKQGDQNLIVAKGATIRSLTFDQSENKWFNYSPFTAEIEFNEVDFLGCSSNPAIACNSSFFHSPHQSGTNPIINNNLIDIQKYKIKEFTDEWSFTIDNSIYEVTDFLNNNFRVTYTLSATGKNYYVDDKLVPAWQQAKLFAQERLFDQVKGLLNGILQITTNNSDGCNPTYSLDDLHQVDNSSPRTGGLLSGFNIPEEGGLYDVYNETIRCETSEAAGSFSLTYNAIIKRTPPSGERFANAALHSYTQDISYSEGSNQNVNITLKGTITGLIPGGLIYKSDDFYTLPKNGQFIYASNNNTNNKYDNALKYYYQHISNNFTDLYPDVKTRNGINFGTLNIKGDPNNINFQPTSFALEHNYSDGIISYTAIYDKLNASTFGRGYTNISVEIKEPVELIQEFVIPGRISGPVIQKLGMSSAKIMSININGASDSDRFLGPTLDIVSVCNTIPTLPANIASLLNNYDNGKALLTKKDYNTNTIDGSFNVNLEYIYY